MAGDQPLAGAGETDTGVVYEQVSCIEDDQRLRRIVLILDEPTRDGETEIVLVTNVPSESASACALAELYRRRWLIEGAFQELAEHLSRTSVEMGSVLQDLAGRVRLSAFKKHRRGPKKKPPRRRSKKTEPHVSTARLLAQRRARNQTP